MKVIHHEQGSQDWLDWRRSHVTATDASIILGLNHFKGIYQLWQEKMGFIDPEPENEAMKRGQLLEPIARDLLCEQLDIDFKPMVIQSDQYRWMGASLDGISQDHSLICEIKCMKLGKHLQVSADNIDPCHYAQIQHQLACSNADMACYVSYHPDAIEKLTIVEVFPNEDYIKKMIYKEKYFFENCMCRMECVRESWHIDEYIN